MFSLYACSRVNRSGNFGRRRGNPAARATMKTLYDLLGALPHDDAEGLRTAFRKAVKGAHPDLRPDDPDAAPKFREIVRANEILRDLDQREAYDHLLCLAHVEQRSGVQTAGRLHKDLQARLRRDGVRRRLHHDGGGIFAVHAHVGRLGRAIGRHRRRRGHIARGSLPSARRRRWIPPTRSRRPQTPPLQSMPSRVSRRTPPWSAPVWRVSCQPLSTQPPMLTRPRRERCGSRGMSAYRHGDLHGAIADLDQALQHDPKIPARLYRPRHHSLSDAKDRPRLRRHRAGETDQDRPDRPKPPPAMVGKPRVDQAAITGSVTPSSQRLKVSQRPLREETYAPLWVR